MQGAHPQVPDVAQDTDVGVPDSTPAAGNGPSMQANAGEDKLLHSKNEDNQPEEHGGAAQPAAKASEPAGLVKDASKLPPATPSLRPSAAAADGGPTGVSHPHHACTLAFASVCPKTQVNDTRR